MSELRQNLATKEWYVIATERAKRPHDFTKGKKKFELLPERVDSCPFCPGNEHMTPPASLVLGDGSDWQVRVVANKFSAFSPQGTTERRVNGIHRSMAGVGIHEVLIERPEHNKIIPSLSDQQMELIMRAYRHRYRAHIKDPRVEMIIVFKNYGEGAGCSLAHPHSQLIAMPLVPTHLRYRIEEARRHYDDFGGCVFCHMVEMERSEGIRMVTENEHFVAFCPYACGAPYEVWIIPKRHISSFGSTNDEELHPLGQILKDILSRIHYGLSDPDYNYVIRSVPKDEGDALALHWYIKMMPRLAKQAGFELGSGMYVNVTLPEDNAKFLRQLEIPAADDR